MTAKKLISVAFTPPGHTSGMYPKRGIEDEQTDETRRQSILEGVEEKKTHYRVCNKCNTKKPIEVFEGYKRCKDCRDRSNKSWHRIMVGYKRAGLKQRIPLEDDEKEKILKVFADACAFCGQAEEKKLRFTRLIAPRNGGGDELFNIIPCCTSCMQSRKGWATWEDWYKSQPDIYDRNRFNVIIAHHNEQPIPERKPVNKR